MADVPFSTFSVPSNGYLNLHQGTVTSSFVVPAGVYQIGLKVTAGGGAGGASQFTSSLSYGASGGAAGGTIEIPSIQVRPGDVISYIIGGGGTAPAGGTPGAGGITSVMKNSTIPLAVAYGGAAGFNANGSSANTRVSPINKFYAVRGDYLSGGYGGRGGPNGSTPSEAGGKVVIRSLVSGDSTTEELATPSAIGGISGNIFTPGGAGGSSAYGIGGTGSNGGSSPTSRNSVQGGDAPTTSYGAGGGGSSSGDIGPAVRGGNGANGIVEIYY